jgi:hypothetical protein
MSQETGGNDEERKVKIASAVMILLSIPGCGIGAFIHSDVMTIVSIVLFFGGLAGFIMCWFERWLDE